MKCKYCGDSVEKPVGNLMIFTDDNGQGIIRVYMEGFDVDIDYIELLVNNCPMCGRSITK